MAQTTVAEATDLLEMVIHLRYRWRPFTVDGHHLSFREHRTTRLGQNRCSHWGPAVYKWQGPVADGPNAGRVGVLIGETGNLRQRIKQYVSGTQPRGNRLWRESFLELGDIHLYVMDPKAMDLAEVMPMQLDGWPFFHRPNMRLLIEQLLVMRAVGEAGERGWVVNARQ